MRKGGPFMLMVDNRTAPPKLPNQDRAGVFPSAARRCESRLH